MRSLILLGLLLTLNSILCDENFDINDLVDWSSLPSKNEGKLELHDAMFIQPYKGFKSPP